MRVLVTRPAADAAPLAETLKARGFEPVIGPLLDIRFREGAAPELAGIGAFAFTSANGVRALMHRRPAAAAMDLPVFAVGPATAKAARDAGFKKVSGAGGDVAALARLIATEFSPAEGAVLHLAGSERAGDLVRALENAGIAARRAVLYEAVAAESLSAELRRMIAGGGIGAVIIFSPRTARLFVNLMKKAGLASNARAMMLVALSPAVGAAATGLPWRAVRVASAPDGDALLRALGGADGS